jgi:hypothetical protein
MDGIKTIADCDGHNQRNHSEVPKRSPDELLEGDKEGHGNQPQSHKATLLTNATRAL